MFKIAGNDLYHISATPEHEPGMMVDDPRGKSGVVTINRVIAGAVVTQTIRYSPDAEYRYIQASNAIVGAENGAGGDALKMDEAQTDTVKPIRHTPTTAVTSQVDAVAHISITDEFYGFVQTRGRVYNAKVLDAGTAESQALGASGTAATLVGITASAAYAQAEAIAAINYAAGRRAKALQDVGVNLWDILLMG